jgi:hypothetical protein
MARVSRFASVMVCSLTPSHKHTLTPTHRHTLRHIRSKFLRLHAPLRRGKQLLPPADALVVAPVDALVVALVVTPVDAHRQMQQTSWHRQPLTARLREWPCRGAGLRNLSARIKFARL